MPNTCTSAHQMGTAAAVYPATLTLEGLQVDRGTASGLFPGDWSAIFKCTFALAYVLVASYLVLFFLFWLCKSAFIDHPTTTIIVESSELLFSSTASIHAQFCHHQS